MEVQRQKRLYRDDEEINRDCLSEMVGENLLTDLINPSGSKAPLTKRAAESNRESEGSL